MESGLPPREAPNSYVLYEDVAYDEFWQSLPRRKLDQLEHALVRELLPAEGRRIIDIGCGYGRLTDCYIDRFDQAVLFDGSFSLLKLARRRHGARALYVWGDANHLPFREAAFDAMLLVRVLHHLPDSDDFLREARRLLCDRATLVLSYSNKRNAFRVLRFLLGRAPHNPFTTEPLAVEPNFIHHHPAYISGKLKTVGFQASLLRGAGVLDALASALGPAGAIVPPGTRLAPALGKMQIAPWVFCRATAKGGEELRQSAKTGDLLVCPCCHSELGDQPDGFECISCGEGFPIIDGIIDMRPVSAGEGRYDQSKSRTCSGDAAG